MPFTSINPTRKVNKSENRPLNTKFLPFEVILNSEDFVFKGGGNAING